MTLVENDVKSSFTGLKAHLRVLISEIKYAHLLKRTLPICPFAG